MIVCIFLMCIIKGDTYVFFNAEEFVNLQECFLLATREPFIVAINEIIIIPPLAVRVEVSRTTSHLRWCLACHQ